MKNFIIRTISGVTFAAIMIVCFLWNTLSYAVIMSLIIAAMMNEFFNISMGRRFIVQKSLAITSGLFIFILSLLVKCYGLPVSIMLLAVLPVIGIFISNLYVKGFNKQTFIEAPDGSQIRVNNGYETVPFAIAGIFYIAIPMSMCNLIVFIPSATEAAAAPLEYSGKLLLGMLALLWATDVGAYCLGTAIGQKYGKKLFPSISPKKSWVGFWGGMLCSILVAIAINKFLLEDLDMAASIGLAIIICIFGVWGDLVESQLKRNYGVKDSGSIMPGHGGMLDRFDGALIAFPIAVIYLYFFILN